MNRIVRNFVMKVDGEYGSLGWVSVNAPPEFNTGDGRVVAHDMLEHFDESSTWESELMALGAMIFIRYETGYFSGNYYPNLYHHLSGDIGSCIEFTMQNRDLMPINSNRIDYHESDINEAIRKSCIDIINYSHFDKRPTEENKKRVVGWLRRGYRRAKRRYGGDNRKASRLFAQIESKVNEIRHSEEGDQIRVSVSLSKAMVNVEFKERGYY